MTHAHPSRLAVALLEALGADPTLIGDLLEAFEIRRSNLWLWGQTLAAVPHLVVGRGRHPEPHRWKSINLAVTPRSTGVGGLGLVALAALTTIMAPGAWWIVAIGAGGGVLLGVVMIAAARHRLRHTAGSQRILPR